MFENVQVMYFAGALAIALAGSYIVWGPSQNPKKKLRNAVPGLQNLGNSCFLNAVLQALASCSLFIGWLNTVVNAKNKQGDGDSYTLSTALLSLMRELNAGSGSCSAMDVVNALRRWRWTISDEEQDAHELFHVLTTTLEEEVLDNPPVLSLLDIPKLEKNNVGNSNIAKKPFIGNLGAQSMKNTLPFRGLMANQLICKQCRYKYPVKYDTFDSVSLSIPSPFWGPLKLQDCLKKFVSCEQVSDVTCDICCKSSSNNLNAAFQKKTTFIKQLSFGKLPECLCFHIQRTVWRNNGVPTKCYDHVAFPEVLCMDQFMYSNSNKNNSAKEGPMQVQTKLIGGSSEAEEKLHKNTLGAEIGNGSLPVPSELPNKRPSLLLGENSIPIADHMYYLKAVIVHLGDLLSGHFVTYRRGPLGTGSERKWFCTSDSSTREVSFSDVSQVCAYMLYYEKISAVK